MSTLTILFRFRISRNKGTKKEQNGSKKEPIYQSITYQQYPPPRHRSDTDDSLDSNYQNKSSFQSIYQVSQDNLTYADTGLNLPNYYPDPRYDTDVSVKTDNYSLYSESDYFDDNTRSLPNFAYEFDPNSGYYESNTFNPIYSECDYQSISGDDSGSELNNFDEITVVNNKNKEELDEKPTNVDVGILSGKSSDENFEKIELTVESPLTQDQDYITTITIDDHPPEQVSTKPAVKRQNSFRKPLNFITKNISKAFGDKERSKKSKQPPNVTESQYYSSLPDINASRYLEKCERIDRKLRKCDKYPKNPDRNRFVVNIGQHLNIAGDNTVAIPVDFEIKISKIPKKDRNNNEKSNSIRQKIKKSNSNILPKIAEVTEKDSKKATNDKPLKTIRNFTKIDEKPENIYWKKTEQAESVPIDIPKRVVEEYKDPEMELGFDNKSLNPEKEFQEKIDTMRCFWDKMTDKAEEQQEKGTKEEEQEKPLSPKLVISHYENLASEKTSPKPEPCKIVDVQSKIENVRKIFEQFPEKPKEIGPSLVETNKKIFEPPKIEKTFVRESCELFENNCFPLTFESHYESLNPNIVEIIEKRNYDTVDCKQIGFNDANFQNGATLRKIKDFEIAPEFDHVRYKVMKSDLFQKNIFANYEKESQFDGLMQYLQDYSFQELLIDNNIVIIEPIRTKVEYQDSQNKSRKLTQIIPKMNNNSESKQSSLRRHFFYHPIRVNREVNDEELPNPDTVKQVRQIFERSGVMERSHSSKELDNKPKKKTICYQTVVDPDRDHCSDVSDCPEKNSNNENSNEIINEENLDSLEDEKQYISEDVLKKIRECGTCITYYGGKILKKNNDEQLSPMTKAIMEEIRGWQKRNEECGCKKRGTRRNSNEKFNDDGYQGIKFKLIKSNSCSSRLELVGTENLSEYRRKFLEKQKKIVEEQNVKNQENEKTLKDSINHESKANGLNSPKIVGEEKKLPPWKMEEEKKKDKKMDDFKHYKVKKSSKKYDDMEFEHFEVLEK